MISSQEIGLGRVGIFGVWFAAGVCALHFRFVILGRQRWVKSDAHSGCGRDELWVEEEISNERIILRWGSGGLGGGVA